MAGVNASGLTFQEELASLEASLRETHPDLTWERAAVYEIETGPGVEYEWEWTPMTRVYDPAAYEDRFKAILNQVARSWVNLSAETIHGDTLIVSLEWVWEDPYPYPLDYENRISVNPSGFPTAKTPTPP